MLSCISRRSALLSHHGGWMPCHATTITRMMIAKMEHRTTVKPNRALLDPTAEGRCPHINPADTSSVKIMLRHSSQRQGNCMNCIFGSSVHSTADTENISKLHAAAHASSAVQSSR